MIIRATDGGTEPGPLSAEVALRAVFVPTQGEPTFSTNTFDVGFVGETNFSLIIHSNSSLTSISPTFPFTILMVVLSPDSNLLSASHRYGLSVCPTSYFSIVIT